jgi:hypothetical protein
MGKTLGDWKLHIFDREATDWNLWQLTTCTETCRGLPQLQRRQSVWVTAGYLRNVTSSLGRQRAHREAPNVMVIDGRRAQHRDQTVRLSYVTSSQVEGKQMHVVRNPTTLPIQELRPARYELLPLEHNVCVTSLPATNPNTPEPLTFHFWRIQNSQIRPGCCQLSSAIPKLCLFWLNSSYKMSVRKRRCFRGQQQARSRTFGNSDLLRLWTSVAQAW